MTAIAADQTVVSYPSTDGEHYQIGVTGQVGDKAKNTILYLISGLSEPATTTSYDRLTVPESTTSGLATETNIAHTQTTAEAILEVRRRSGLTWEQLSELFDVSRRSVHHWANGKPMSTQHEGEIRRILAALRHVDEGSQAATRDRLLTIGPSGLSTFDLLAARRFDEVMGQVAGSTPTESRRIAVSWHAQEALRPTPPALLLDADQERPDIPVSKGAHCPRSEDDEEDGIMIRPVADEGAVDYALRHWRQGDVSLDAGLEFIHLADLSRPHSQASAQAAASNGTAASATGTTPILEEVPGVVLLTQTCDVVRKCRERPFVEVAPLVKLNSNFVEEIRRLKRPAFAYIPATAPDCLVADLDRVMTVEKAVVATWTRTPGWNTDDEIRNFARALARKRSRFAFPDDFVGAVQPLQAHIVDKHNKDTCEGAHLRTLREIRVRGAPSWSHDEVQLTWWFIKEHEPTGVTPAWADFADKWIGLFDQTGRFRIDEHTVCRLEDISAREYLESDVLDLDRLSISRKPPQGA